MLPRAHRLPLRFFRYQVESAGLTFPSPLFLIKVAQLPDRAGQPSRFSFIVSQKIASQAVDRNRLRRRLAAIIRGRLPQLNPGFDIILYAKKTAASVDFKELQDRLLQLLSQAHVLSSL